jgi:hypothetical protein
LGAPTSRPCGRRYKGGPVSLNVSGAEPSRWRRIAAESGVARELAGQNVVIVIGRERARPAPRRVVASGGRVLRRHPAAAHSILCTSRKRPPLAYDEGERRAIMGARMMKRAGPQLGVVCRRTRAAGKGARRPIPGGWRVGGALSSRGLVYFRKVCSCFKLIAAGVARPDYLSLAYTF